MENDETTCPDCAETIKAAAKVCKHCGFRFPISADNTSEEAPHNSGDNAASIATWEQTAPSPVSLSDNALVARSLLFVLVMAFLYWAGSFALDRTFDKPVKQTALPTADIDAGERDYDKDISEVEDRQKGFHCLSSIDGSQPELVEAVKHGLRDPDSY